MNNENRAATSASRFVASRTWQLLREHGPGYTLRRAIRRLYEHRFRRLQSQMADAPAPEIIQFLGADFELHPSGKGLSEALRLFGVHEPMASRFYRQSLAPGDHVIDVGSNIGYYVLVAHQVSGPTGRILGFEPVPELFAALQRNIGRRGLNNVTVFPWAIGATNGTIEFYQSDVPNWGSMIYQHDLFHNRKITVPIRRLDDVIKEQPGFRPTVLRMDVEGAELMVLEGARELLAAYRPTLFIEFHTFTIGWEAIRRTLFDLRSLGYSNGILVDRVWDEPWISEWTRRWRSWRVSVDRLLRQDGSSDRIAFSFSLILQRPET